MVYFEMFQIFIQFLSQMKQGYRQATQSHNLLWGKVESKPNTACHVENAENKNKVTGSFIFWFQHFQHGQKFKFAWVHCHFTVLSELFTALSLLSPFFVMMKFIKLSRFSAQMCSSSEKKIHCAVGKEYTCAGDRLN